MSRIINKYKNILFFRRYNFAYVPFNCHNIFSFWLRYYHVLYSSRTKIKLHYCVPNQDYMASIKCFHWLNIKLFGPKCESSYCLGEVCFYNFGCFSNFFLRFLTNKWLFTVWIDLLLALCPHARLSQKKKRTGGHLL